MTDPAGRSSILHGFLPALIMKASLGSSRARTCAYFNNLVEVASERLGHE